MLHPVVSSCRVWLGQVVLCIHDIASASCRACMTLGVYVRIAVADLPLAEEDVLWWRALVCLSVARTSGRDLGRQRSPHRLRIS